MQIPTSRNTMNGFFGIFPLPSGNKKLQILRDTQRQFSENICSEAIWDLEFSEHLL